MLNRILAAGLLSISMSEAAAWELESVLSDVLELGSGAMGCTGRVADCADQIYRETLVPLAWQGVWTYKDYLFNQADGGWKVLPDWFVTAAQPYYPSVDLTAVRFAEGIETLHGRHITWGDHIFFVGPLNLHIYEGVHLMLHELEHVRQYREAGGERPFLSRYLAESLQAVAQAGSIDIHSQLALEQAAEAAADGLAAVVHSARP